MSALGGGLILLGALLAFGGALGLVRLKTFYERVHPPTMGTTLGTALILTGAAIATPEGAPVARYLLIAAFMLVTTPVSYILLVAAARRRRR
jgi:multicomponent K+:H+ antiporter subunit G